MGDQPVAWRQVRVQVSPDELLPCAFRLALPQLRAMPMPMPRHLAPPRSLSTHTSTCQTSCLAPWGSGALGLKSELRRCAPRDRRGAEQPGKRTEVPGELLPAHSDWRCHNCGRCRGHDSHDTWHLGRCPHIPRHAWDTTSPWGSLRRARPPPDAAGGPWAPRARPGR